MLVSLSTVTRLALGASFVFTSLTACTGLQPTNAVGSAGPLVVQQYRPMIAIDGARSVLQTECATASLDEVACQRE